MKIGDAGFPVSARCATWRGDRYARRWHAPRGTGGTVQLRKCYSEKLMLSSTRSATTWPGLDGSTVDPMRCPWLGGEVICVPPATGGQHCSARRRGPARRHRTIGRATISHSC